MALQESSKAADRQISVRDPRAGFWGRRSIETSSSKNHQRSGPFPRSRVLLAELELFVFTVKLETVALVLRFRVLTVVSGVGLPPGVAPMMPITTPALAARSSTGIQVECAAIQNRAAAVGVSPARFSVPVPARVSPLLPLIGAEIVGLTPAATVMAAGSAAVPVRASESPEIAAMV